MVDYRVQISESPLVDYVCSKDCRLARRLLPAPAPREDPGAGGRIEAHAGGEGHAPEATRRLGPRSERQIVDCRLTAYNFQRIACPRPNIID